MTDKELLTRFADIKLQIKRLEFDLGVLAPDILPIVSKFIETHDGTLPAIEGKGAFNIIKKKTWVYSQNYEDQKKLLEELKVKEQQTGMATCEEKPILVFKEESL